MFKLFDSAPATTAKDPISSMLAPIINSPTFIYFAEYLSGNPNLQDYFVAAINHVRTHKVITPPDAYFAYLFYLYDPNSNDKLPAKDAPKPSPTTLDNSVSKDSPEETNKSKGDQKNSKEAKELPDLNSVQILALLQNRALQFTLQLLMAINQAQQKQHQQQPEDSKEVAQNSLKR